MFYFINLCFQNLLKTATDCCWTERQIQWDAWGSVHTARVAQQCLHVNCLHMIQKKQWPSNSPHLNHSADIMSGEQCTKLLKASPEAKYSFWIKNCRRENGKILCRTKLSREVDRVHEVYWKTFKAFADTQKKCSHLHCCACTLSWHD